MTFHAQQQELFEQPASGDVALLSCTHRASLPPTPKRLTDGWWASLHCPECGTNRQVVTVIYQGEKPT